MDPGFDLVALNSYLESHVNGFSALQKATKFADGQSNPTFLLDADSGQYVLRKQPVGELLKSAHAVDREFRLMQALQGSEIPVPKVFHLCMDKKILGCLFFIMSFEDGRIFWDPGLPGLSNTDRTNVYHEMNRILANLHDVDITSVGLGDFGKPGDYFSRQISRWTRQYRASETTFISAMDRLIAWLPANTPADDGKVSLIHGDFRIDNIIFCHEKTKAKAILDWELSTLGHPFADLAYQCMQWRWGRDAVIPGLGDRDRAALGIPTESEYVAQYCQRRGIQGIPNWDFYLVFSFFRIAAIVQGVGKRAIDGNASSVKAKQYGELAPVLASMAVELID